jgi:hypothetical protein
MIPLLAQAGIASTVGWYAILAIKIILSLV